MRLTGYDLGPGEHVLTIRRVEPVVVTKARSTAARFERLRWDYASEDGEPYVEHTTRSGGRGSNARTIAEAALGTEIRGGFETNDLQGRKVIARIVSHPRSDWRLRIAEVRSLDGEHGGLLRGRSGRTIDSLIEDRAESTEPAAEDV